MCMQRFSKIFCRVLKSLSSAAAKRHIKEIRKEKFSIGVGSKANPLTEDLHHAVHNLSLELYTKDIHFLMELIQNAEDNEYPEGVEPSLEFVITANDITGTGAPMTLLVFNNEVGFSRSNMDSICSIGKSSKKGRRQEGFVGEKGIGFKSVFLISKQPYIYSGGYQVKFSDKPNKECGIGYIVPEWVKSKPTIADINDVYGSQKELPTTVIILPLKSEKVKAVKKQLSKVHPELLLFLSKIKQLSVREHVHGSTTNGILSSISISSRHELLSTGDGSTTSYFVQLSAQEGIDMKCWYYMWRQVFPVKRESKVGGRKELNEWAISLAFPFDKRLTRGATSGGIFAFLPTEMVTGFPFIIHADFILTSSRETILMDNKWNLGILDCLPFMFVDAFVSYVKSSDQPLSNLVKMFYFLPIKYPFYAILNGVRETIRTILKTQHILPCESFSDEQMGFCKPVEAIRLLPEFRKLLLKAKGEGLSLNHSPVRGRFILESSIDDTKYDRILDFLGVNSSSTNNGRFYWQCIECWNLMNQVSEDVYLDLLCFIKDTNAKSFNYPYREPFGIPMVKYAGRIQSVTGASNVTNTNTKAIYYAKDFRVHSWLSKCNVQFASQNGPIFISNSMHKALERHTRRYEIISWLEYGKCAVSTSVKHYINILLKTRLDSQLVILLAHFLYYSFEDKLVSEIDVYYLCCNILPIVDGHGHVHTKRAGTLVPASQSKWVKLFSVNPFKMQKFVELGEIYASSRDIAGKSAPQKSVLCFLIKYSKALDLPEILPPDVELPISDAHLTADQAFLLLDWIQYVKLSNSSMPEKFIGSIKSGNWMKTSAGFKSPDRSFLFDGNQESILIEMIKVLPTFPVIDEQYYRHRGRITQYTGVLKFIGVKFVSEDSYAAVDEQLIHFVSSKMTKDNTYLLLKYIHHAKQRSQLSEILLNTLKKKEWLKTTQGYRSPFGSLFVRSKMDSVAQITNLAVIDEVFYGDEINSYVPELELMGVVVDMDDVYKHILGNFTFPSDPAKMKSDSVLFMLRCIREMGPSHIGLMDEMRKKPWMRTTVGFCCPPVCMLFDADWGPLSDIAVIPLVDEEFYGNGIRSFVSELKTLGVAVDLNDAQNAIAAWLKSTLTSDSLTCDDMISILNCIKYFMEKMPSMLHVLRNSLLSVSFLKTRHGYRSPPASILFDSKWGVISQFVDLPLIDDSFYGIEIYAYRSELEQMGVIVDYSEGSNFVATGLKLPKEPGKIGTETSFMLLQSVRGLLNNSSNGSLPQPFLDNISESKWLKTHSGYRAPKDCLLFDSTWASNLKPTDGPFLDQEFYGSNISSYREELKAVGVKVEIEVISMLMYQSLGLHNNLQVITRIYGFLSKIKWRPSSEHRGNCEVWIPCGADMGNWVKSQHCVVNDKSSLFGSAHHQLYALNKYYKKPLLQFFSSAFEVRESPSVNDYVALWKSWELEEQHEVTHDECHFIWGYIVSNWDSNAEFLMKKILKLPAVANPPEDKIYLMVNKEVCIPDDPDLEAIFTEASKEPLFVWHPHQNAPSIPLHKLHQIYSCLGVKKLSELVKFDASSFSSDSKHENCYMKDGLIVEGLIRIILAFLAGPQVSMPLRKRHETVQSLLKLAVYEASEPVTVPYILQFPSRKKRLVAKTNRVVFWEKKSRKFFVHRARFEERRTNVEFITYFAQEISSIISEKISVPSNDLCKLIQISFAFGFEEDAVSFLLKREDLQTLVEDEEFISSVFSARQFCTKSKRKAPLSSSSPSSTTTSRRKRKLSG